MLNLCCFGQSRIQNSRARGNANKIHLKERLNLSMPLLRSRSRNAWIYLARRDDNKNRTRHICLSAQLLHAKLKLVASGFLLHPMNRGIREFWHRVVTNYFCPRVAWMGSSVQCNTGSKRDRPWSRRINSLITSRVFDEEIVRILVRKNWTAETNWSDVKRTYIYRTAHAQDRQCKQFSARK